MFVVVGLLALAGACLFGGVEPVEGALLLAAGLAMVGRLRPTLATAPHPRVTWGIIAWFTLYFAVAAAVLIERDRPLGTDWMAYLKNAVALGSDQPSLYQRWRGPVHAWALLAATPLAGGLLEASQAVSFVAAVACVPLTGWLGLQVGGPLVGIVAAALLAGWADLRVYAVASTPYPLVACLSLLGTTLTLRAAERPRGWVWAGVALGLAYGTDLRAGTTAIATAVGAWRRGATRPLIGALLLTFAIGAAAIHSLPVDLIPLREQVALQRDLNAREGLGTCPKRGNQLPTLEDLTGRCGRTTFAANLSRASGTLPFGLEVFAALALLGLWHLRGARLLLGLPLLALAPSLLIIGVQHRYFVPLAPLLAVLGAGALVRLLGGSGAGRLGLALVPLAVGVGWSTTPGTLWSRANANPDPASGLDPAMSLVAASAFVPVRTALREAGPKDRIVDCTRADLRIRMYPHPVDTSPPTGPGELSKTCRQLASRGPTASGTTWMLVSGERIVRADVWQVAFSAVDGPSELVLLRATGRSSASESKPAGASRR